MMEIFGGDLYLLTPHGDLPPLCEGQVGAWIVRVMPPHFLWDQDLRVRLTSA